MFNNIFCMRNLHVNVIHFFFLWLQEIYSSIKGLVGKNLNIIRSIHLRHNKRLNVNRVYISELFIDTSGLKLQFAKKKVQPQIVAYQS